MWIKGQKQTKEHIYKRTKSRKRHGTFKVSLATKNKIRNSKKGKKLSEEHRLKISISCKGIRPSKKTREKMSQSATGNISAWKGGLSKFPYSQEWTETLRKSIRQRDNFICQLCNKTQKRQGCKLSIHHIDYDKQNCDPKNLITLCHSCNVKVNTSRSVWTKFFQQKLKLLKVS